MTEEKTGTESFGDYAMEQFQGLTKIAKLDLEWQRGIESDLRRMRTWSGVQSVLIGFLLALVVQLWLRRSPH